jgi:mannose-6-phosphate isomerase-like protein (cupin superfamily)
MAVATKQKFSIPVDKSVVEKQWRERGFSCDWFVDPPGREWLDFMHNCNELVTVVEGRLEMWVGQEGCVLDPGDEILIPRGARHSVKNVYPGTTRWLYGYD